MSKKIKIIKQFIPYMVASIILGLFLFVSATAYKNESRRAVDNITKIYMEELSHQISTLLRTNLDNHLSRMETIGYSIPSDVLESTENLQDYLSVIKETNDFAQIAFVDAFGMAIFEDQIYSLSSKIENLPDLVNGPTKLLISYDEAIWDEKLLFIGISIPSKLVEDHIIKALIIGVDMNKVQQKFFASDDASSYTNIIKKDGSFIIKSTENVDYGLNLLDTLKTKADFDRRGSADKVIDDIEINKSDMVSFIIDGNHEYLYYTNIENTDFYVCLGMSYDIVNSQVFDLTTFIIFLGSMIIVVFIFLITGIFVEYRNREKKYQNSLLKEREKAVRANLYKTRFLSQISHEIRTPLNGVMGMTQIGLKNYENKVKVKNCLEKIELSSRTLLALINDILDISKIESGKITIYHEEFNFNVLIKSLVTIFYSECKRHHLHFTLNLGGNLEEILIGDSLRLNQILTNLLSNAIKFTKENGNIILEIDNIKTEDNKIWLRFIVEDSGKGIKPENIDKIFETFVQEDVDVFKNYGGTGLGLPISKSFTELMGGKIEVQSELGKGSKFIVEIPFEFVRHTVNKLPEYNYKKVMVVYPNTFMTPHLNNLLTDKGFIVTEVHDLYNAYKEFEREDYGYCFIIDEFYRVKELIDWVKTKNKDTKFILLGYDKDDLEEIKVDSKADLILQRPVSEVELEEAFRLIEKDLKAKKEEKLFDGLKILVAEDNELNREIILEILEMNGASVDLAFNGQIAFDKFKDNENYYDLILMDIEMPVLNGYEATKLIRSLDREEAKEIIIITMTAYAFQDDIDKSLEVGMNAHISKPFNIEQLYEKYHRVLEKKNEK